MSLIDHTYFLKGRREIPNTETLGVSERLNGFIEDYEPEFLRAMFGYSLSKEFMNATADFDPDGSNSTIDQKWLDLIEGAEYTKNNRLEKFNGLQDMVADYVYFMYKKYEITQSSQLGETKPRSENASNENPGQKMIDAWERLSEGVCKLYDFMQKNKDTYPEWANHDHHKMLSDYGPINGWGI